MRRGRERGVALVLVLGLVALISVWAVESADADWISLRRAENMRLAAQAWLAAESGLALGRRVLQDDGTEVDALDDDWARDVPPMPVDGGTIRGHIIDGNRFFNLNNLVGVDGKTRPEAVAIARRLFTRLRIDPSLVDALIDWMDADSIPFGPGGGEDEAYLDKPWRVKNAPLDNLREVLLIRGFDRDTLERLRSAAVVLPRRTAVTPVNINTAVKDVLLSLAEGIPETDVEQMLRERKTNPWKTVSAWVSQRPYSAWAARIPPVWLGTTSRYFIVRATARFGRVVWAERMLLARTGGTLRLLRRERLLGEPG